MQLPRLSGYSFTTRMQGMLDRFVGWWTAPARTLHACLVAAAIGLLAYLVGYGAGHMFGTSPYWDLPQYDSRAYLMAYRYWLHEPWHWPLFDSNTMNVPYAKSIAYSDAIPLWALFNKAIATVVPPWGAFTERAYLGLWYALVFMLQACFGVAILRQLGQRSWGAAIVTALFFIAVPSWILRYVHASMTGHFLLLWALLLYLRAPAGAAAPRRHYIGALIQLAVAALVNPYHVVMSLGVFAAMLVRSRSLRVVGTWLLAGIVVVGAAAWIAGYFSSASGVAMPGFEVGGTNVLSMLVPLSNVPSGILGGGSWMPNVNPTGYQYEGFAYLGLGILAMLVMFLPHAKAVRDAISRHPFLFVVVLGAWLFALSNHVYVGSHRVLDLDIPKALRWLPEHYRAPGRFVWLPMYVVIIFLLAWSLARFRTGWRMWIVPALCVVQMFDARGAWSWPHLQFTGNRLPSVLDLAAWRPLVHAHDAVLVNPSYDCVHDGTPNVDLVSLEIQWLASQRALPINGVYTARPTRDCRAEALGWGALEPRGNILYVFLPRAARLADRMRSLGASCGDFAVGHACSSNHAAIEAAIRTGTLRPRSATEPLPRLAYAQRLEFGVDSDAAFLLEGWSFAEPGGRWTDGPGASILFELVTTLPETAALKLQASAPLVGNRRAQDVEVSINGTVLGSLHFDQSTPEANDNETVRALSLPVGLRNRLRERSTVVITLRPKDTRPPRKLGGSDKRQLGVWVRRIWFE